MDWKTSQLEAVREKAKLYDLDSRLLSDDDCKAFLEWRRDRKQEHQTSLHAIVWALSEQGQAEFATEREKLADLIKFRQLQDAAI